MNRASEGQASQVIRKPVAGLDHKPQVAEALELLTSRRERLQVAVSALAGRLSGILRPDSPSDTQKSERESMVPVADIISMEALHVDGVADFIDDLLRRLEL